VTSVHRGQHIEHFHTTDLTEDDAVRAHPQGVADQVAGFHLAMPFGIGRAGFEAHHMGMAQLQFGYVLDGDQAFMGVDQLAEDIEQRGFTGTGTTADQDIAALAHRLLKELIDRLVDGLHGHQVAALQHVLAKFPDRQARAIQGNGRNDRVDPAAIGQACIDHRRGLVQTPPQRRQNALHHPFHMMVIDKTQIALAEPPLALDKHPMGAVDQDFSHGRVAQQHFEGAETGQLVDDLFGQPLHFITGNGQVQTRHILGYPLGNKLGQRHTGAFQQVFPGFFNGIDDIAVQHQFKAVMVRPAVFIQA